jgi:hypothetical protein
VPDDGYAPAHVNVADQRRDPESLLTFIQTLVRRYRESPELGWGHCEVLDHPFPAVLALRTTWDDASTITLHNLSGEPVAVPLKLADLPPETRLVDLLQNGRCTVGDAGAVEVELPAYGYRWLRVSHPESRRLL